MRGLDPSITSGTGKTELLVWLSEAERRYPEPAWRTLRSSLEASEEIAPARLEAETGPAIPSAGESQVQRPDSREWFRRMPVRVSMEAGVLGRLMTLAEESPGLFSIAEDSGRLWATGLVEIGAGCLVKLELEFGDDYPVSPAKAYFRGHALYAFLSGLRADGSVPVPREPEQWTAALNSGFIVIWASEWLAERARIEPLEPVVSTE
jgi:hypothetical protein